MDEIPKANDTKDESAQDGVITGWLKCFLNNLKRNNLGQDKGDVCLNDNDDHRCAPTVCEM